MSNQIKIAGFGVTTLDYIALVEELDSNKNAKISMFETVLGGLTGNAILAAKRLGAKTSLKSFFGNDEAGEKILHLLSTENIDTIFCEKISGKKSLFSFITIDFNTGERTIFSHKDNIDVLQEAIDFSFLDNADACLLDIHWKEAGLAVAKEANKRNIPIIADFRINKENTHILNDIDYPIISIDYALSLSDDGKIETALHKMKDSGAGNPIITAGKNGCYYIDEISKKSINIPAFKINPVDTCGAGDVFHGAFAFAITQFTLKEALLFASASSAIKCTRFGGGKGSPSFEEVMLFLKKYNL